MSAFSNVRFWFLVSGLGWLCLTANATVARADVILTTTNLNESLKTMERLRQQIGSAPAGSRADLLFQIGLEGEALAELMSDEVIAHGMDQKPLLDLGLARTKAIGVGIAWDREKRKFLYDGAAFRQALEDAPNGTRAADATFKVIEGEFFRSTGKNVTEVLAAARRKEAFIKAYPRHARLPDVNLMLGIDLRDLARLYQELKDRPHFARYRDRARTQLRLVSRRYPGAEQGKVATEMLKRFDAEFGEAKRK